MERMEKPQARLIDIQLDQKSLSIRLPQVRHEREVAMNDLLAFNRFALVKPCADQPDTAVPKGPFRLQLSLQDNRRLVFEIFDEHHHPLQRIVQSLMPFRRIIKDYFVLCESYYDALKQHSQSQIETIDMARRGMHNEGAELLREELASDIMVDKNTARRLFTLIAVLHITG